MKILHTADWHIGQLLHSRKRYGEAERFLQWLLQTLAAEAIDVLLVAGDVFDTTAPSNYAQGLYNDFLAEVPRTACRHVVVTGGNHDSPSLLNAQRKVLKHLRIHVVGGAEDDPADEVLLLRDDADRPELIVCAVPYLRDRDIRKAEAGETTEEKGRHLVEGIRRHYAEVCRQAAALRDSLPQWVPIVAMGHLFAADGATAEGDGVRQLYVGSLGHVHADIFPDFIDYTALGHLHSHQMVGGRDNVRYSGSPLPMSFGEADHEKVVLSVTVEQGHRLIKTVTVPRFQAIKRLRGDWEELFAQIGQERQSGADTLIEITYTGGEYIDPLLQKRLEGCVDGSSLHILSINNERKRQQLLAASQKAAALEELQPLDVFNSVLDGELISGDCRHSLVDRFMEVWRELSEADNKRD